MKKSFYLKLDVLAVCAAVSISCGKSVEGPVPEVENPASVEFYAMMQDSDYGKESDTRTVTEDAKHVLWCEGDKVSIFRGENINDEYVVK